MSNKRLRIPTDDVELSPEEICVTQTRQFQRLSNLKQLGLAYLVYPGATHTRGLHSLRCLHEAEQILKVINANEEDRRDVRMAALLHDIGHVPFSHTLEDEHVVLGKHDRPQRLGAALSLLKAELPPHAVAAVDRATPILHALSGQPSQQPQWKSDLVGNTVCADLLAYITTDAEYTGIVKRPGHYRIYEYFHRLGDNLCIKLTKGGVLRTDIVSAVMDLLDMRYALTERVLFHHAKCVASGMLARAARLCGLGENLEQLTVGGEPLTEEKLLSMGDERFFDLLEELAAQRVPAERDGALRLVECLRSRRLYQRVFKVGRKSREASDEWPDGAKFAEKWRDPKQVEQLLRDVEDEVELPRGSLALWCPEQKASMKQAEATVIWGSEETGWKGPFKLNGTEVQNQFEGVHKRVHMIQEQYLDLWTFWVALDRKHTAKASRVVRVLEEQLHIQCDSSFRRTTLTLLPGFEEGMSRDQAVRKTMHKLQPQVEEVLMQQAALDGASHLDATSILTTISQVSTSLTQAEAPKPKRFKGKSPDKEDQGHLLDAEPALNTDASLSLGSSAPANNTAEEPQS